MRFINFLALLSVFLALPLAMTGCGYTKEVREHSAIVIPMATNQLTHSSVAINMLKDNLVAFKEVRIKEYIERNPGADPAEVEVWVIVEDGAGGEELVLVDDIIKNLDKMVEDNKEVARLLDLLNESIQANQGLSPIAGEIRNLAKDPEFQALVKAYIDMKNKKTEE